MGLSRWPEQISQFNQQVRIFSRTNQPARATSLRSKFHTFAMLGIKGRTWAERLFGFPKESMVTQLSLVDKLCPSLITRKLNLDGYFVGSEVPSAFQQDLRRQILGDSADEFVQFPVATVFIHLRLGDHVALVPGLRDSLIRGLSHAHKLVTKTLGQVRFIVISDESESAQSIAASVEGLEWEYLDTSTMSSVQTLRLLSTGQGIVAGHSTFAWWAAFLQQKQSLKVFIQPTFSSMDFGVLQLPNLFLVGFDSKNQLNAGPKR